MEIAETDIILSSIKYRAWTTYARDKTLESYLSYVARSTFFIDYENR